MHTPFDFILTELWHLLDISAVAGHGAALAALILNSIYPASILRKSTSGRHRPVSYPDGPMTARYRFT